jgi:hypothetical protein
MATAGLDVSLKLNGVEMVNSLSKRYEEDLSLRRAAAEFGYPPEKLKENLVQAGDEGLQLYRRLEQGDVPRDSFEGEFHRLVEHSTDEQLIDVTGLDASAAGQKPLHYSPPPALATGRLQLALYSDKSRYSADDHVALTVQSTKDCFLTLIDINQKGSATVLFPNDFQKDNLIRAGAPTAFPGADAGFAFQVAPSDKGPERVLAVCDSKQQNPLSIVHDYASNKFTEIPNFVNRTLVVTPTPHAESGERAQTAITFVVQ